MNPTKVRLVVLGMLIAPAPVAAQLPFAGSLEARVGYAWPTDGFTSGLAGSGVEGGPTFAAGGRLMPTETVGVYLAYQQIRFGCSRCADLDLDDSFTAEGVEAGIHFVPPVTGWPAVPWVRGGLVRQTLGFSSPDDRMTSAAGVGFGAAAGASVAVTRRFGLEAGLRYQSTPVDVRFTIAPDQALDVAAFSADIGGVITF
jgi:hypothetical protein